MQHVSRRELSSCGQVAFQSGIYFEDFYFLEECDESQFWMEMLVESGMISQKKLQPLLTEAGKLTAIFTASRSTARS
jgi:hypothetical protein